ncbi:MAG: HAD-IIIA family hydrolase [Campylobacteraceae bacterium]|nr:HAD-IIIA family hydrolase [Campylobacteraceae bacterium]
MIELLVLDVDGCLTNGGIIYSNSQDEQKVFNVKDGLAIASWVKLGKKVAIITGRKSKAVEIRANELGVNFLFQGVKNKTFKLETILKNENLSFKNVAAIGDDLNDLAMLEKTAWSFTPKDGSHFVQDKVDTILSSNGGAGAVREMIEKIIEKEGMMKEFLKLWQ